MTHLAVEQNVSPSTQNQAFNALIFLYEQVLEISQKNANISAFRAKEKIHIPVVLSKEEVKTILFYTSGVYQLMIISVLNLTAIYNRPCRAKKQTLIILY